MFFLLPLVSFPCLIPMTRHFLGLATFMVSRPEAKGPGECLCLRPRTSRAQEHGRPRSPPPNSSQNLPSPRPVSSVALDTWILGCWDPQLFLEAQRLRGQCHVPPGTERAAPAKSVLRRVRDGDGVGRVGRGTVRRNRTLRRNVQSQQGVNGRPRVSQTGRVAWEGLARLFLYSRHQERDAGLWVLLGQGYDLCPR